MREERMAQVAAQIARVLEAVQPAPVTRGKLAGSPSRSRYRLPDAVEKQVRADVGRLLEDYPAYPGLDLPALQKLIAGANGERSA